MKNQIDLSALQAYSDTCYEFLKIFDAFRSADNALSEKITELRETHTEAAKFSAQAALRSYGDSMKRLSACNAKICSLYEQARNALEVGYSATAELRIPVLGQSRYYNAEAEINNVEIISK